MYRLKRVSAEAKKSGVSPLFLWAIAKRPKDFPPSADTEAT